ncbi:flavonol synthase/flavanone 3-hydroxylase-like isoform X2 [Apium graveolens]|uniref:flavonol synthase/flavanone 3-hydroxylase-like isoform X2 n=1 Tax=Apium graveolens TaxID=4045 RepID=UPI003D7B93B0
MASCCCTTIPTIDLSPLITATATKDVLVNGRHVSRKVVKEEISKACREYGFFQIVNHGIPVDLMNSSLELAKTFFEYPEEEKIKCVAGPGVPKPAGFSKQPLHSPDKNEYLSIFQAGSPHNVLPPNPPQFKGVLEDMFARYSNLAFLVQNIINECLELPPDFLKNYNNIRNSDFLVSLYYLPASDIGNSGKSEHEDGNVVTFVLQDDIGGLEVLHNGEWIPIPPAPGTLVVNVLSNNKFKSATHRVVRPKGTTRNSYAFFYNLDGDKWVEPLPQFTTEIGEPPQYRGFYYKDYVKARVMDRINPPSRLEDRFCIKHYSISNSGVQQ